MPDFPLALLLLGILAGILSGMFGIGGGVVIVPILTQFFGFDLQSATGTSLGALLMPVGVFAVLAYHRAGRLKLSVSMLVAVGLILGSWVGAQVAFALPTRTLQLLYGLFLIYAGWRFGEPRKWLAERRQGAPAAGSVAAQAEAEIKWYWLLLVGVTAGVASGLFGIGGGLVIVPALVGLLHFDQKLAVGTSLGALLLPVSLPAVLTYYNEGKFQLATAALVALGLLFGAFGGAKIALSLPSTTIKRLYAVFLLVVALRFIVQALN
ncbi:MAG: sulfite exporter TauE/SafE family protein [Chloroflexota bacterium]